VTYAASWPALNQGTRGADVSALQRLLAGRGYWVSADGVYGAGTAAAVRRFQAGHGLGADGVVGAGTWSRMAPALAYGSSGQAVAALQQELNAKHGSGLGVDGVFGWSTRAAVISFQKDHGLWADGVVGAATWRELLGHFQDVGATQGYGWFHYGNDGWDDWGTANAEAQFRLVAAEWWNLGYGTRLGLGDISRPHGEAFPPHAGHRDGRGMDLQCIRYDGEAPCDWRQAGYSRARTQQLVNMFYATGQVAQIFFNDPYVKGVTWASGHDNHLHVVWKR
jgi:hypothetical protein